jgi:hypothetical protein
MPQPDGCHQPFIFSGQTVKVPYFNCIPNAKSFCATAFVPASPRPLELKPWLCGDGGGCEISAIAAWDGNAQLTNLFLQWITIGVAPWDSTLPAWFCDDDTHLWPHNPCKTQPNSVVECPDNTGRKCLLNFQEWYMPRGSLPINNSEPELHRPTCVPSPGEHICHKPLPHVCNASDCSSFLWTDSVYNIAQQFDVDWKKLCSYNKMEDDCKALSPIASALKIPSVFF